MSATHDKLAEGGVAAWIASNDSGDWNVSHDGYGTSCHQAIRDAHSGRVIAFAVDHQALGEQPDTRQAARLIVAAPDLLAALKGLDEAFCRAGTHLNKAERHEDRLRLIAARKAIAKATAHEAQKD